MTICLGKSRSLGLQCVSTCERASFPFSYEGGMWDIEFINRSI